MEEKGKQTFGLALSLTYSPGLGHVWQSGTRTEQLLGYSVGFLLFGFLSYRRTGCYRLQTRAEKMAPAPPSEHPRWGW